MYISLIPKIENPVNLTQFRPISLCNVSYKILAKLVVNRIRSFMCQLISEEQTSFVPGRQIIDNIIIMQEVMHSVRIQHSSIGSFIIKVDLEKAYDRLSWYFICDNLVAANFPSNLVCLIMDFVCTIHFNVLWEGRPSTEFYPFRGIRQGDLLSPYIFSLCTERLSRIIKDAMQAGEWKPICLGANGLPLSHIFFTDDLILFGESSKNQIDVMLYCLNKFCDAFEAKFSPSKTKLYFSKNTNLPTAEEICRISGFEKVSNIGKYPKTPILDGHIKRKVFAPLIDNMKQKLSSWCASKLSLVGRVTLIQ